MDRDGPSIHVLAVAMYRTISFPHNCKKEVILQQTDIESIGTQNVGNSEVFTA